MDFDLIKAAKGLAIFISAVGVLILVYYIYLFIIGVVADIATSGSVPVQEDIQTFINTTTAEMTSTWLPNLNAGIAIVFALVVLGVILLLFKPWLKFDGKGGDAVM